MTVAGQWLESPQINAAMMLIKMQFPYVGGLFDTTLGCWDLNFPASTSETWIQIIHDGQDHWIVASKRKGDDFVSIFDSLGDTASDHVVGCLSALLRPKENSFYYTKMLPANNNSPMIADCTQSQTLFHWLWGNILRSVSMTEMS